MKIIDGIDKCIDNNFTTRLLKAVFLLAFDAFLRLGENLVRSSVIQKQDVSFAYCNRRPQRVTLVIRHYKNIKNNQPVTPRLKQITIIRNYVQLQRYILIWKTQPCRRPPVSKQWGYSSYTQLRNRTINFYLAIFRHLDI